MKNNVSVTDFRHLAKTPIGNRFLVYSLFPDSYVNVRIRHEENCPEMIAVSVGHSIFNSGCKVNVGLLLEEFEGGGHRGAASTRFHMDKAEEYIPQIIETLRKNESNE